jgi:hypothetical protein
MAETRPITTFKKQRVWNNLYCDFNHKNLTAGLWLRLR